MKTRKPKLRDDREYDTTQLHEKVHGARLSRDYTAHFFRWNFVRNFVDRSTNLLEIGCGEEKPLSRVLFSGAQNLANQYVGVDLNVLKPGGGGGGRRAVFIGEFNFVESFAKLKPAALTKAGVVPAWGDLAEPPDFYDTIIHLEVIEHMSVENGRGLLRAAFKLLRPGGVMLMSTPCYDGHRHAANHIHEYLVPELQAMVEKAGFSVVRRFGTFMDLRHLKREKPGDGNPELAKAVKVLSLALGEYFDKDAMSCFFAPLFPDHARNNLWVCQKP